MSNLDEIQKLREITGAGVMECKKALDEASGDFDKAIQIIHERGLVKVEKRSGRETSAGIIFSYVHNERIGVLLDLRAETDFVAKSDPFRKLAKELAMQIAATNPLSIDELLAQPYIRDESKIVKNLIEETISIVGENIKINNFARLEI
jgi:elongation factor Ts